jgi:hypothetical protein
MIMSCQVTGVRCQYLAVLLACLIALPLQAADKTGTKKAEPPVEPAKVAKAMNGTFNMEDQPRKYIVFLVLEQEGNRYPSFWTGANRSGEFSLNAQVDELTGNLIIDPTGKLSCEVSHTSRKQGMAEILPGGAWIAGIKDTRPQITFDSYKNWKPGPMKKMKTGETESEAVTAMAEFAGTMSVGSKKAPIKGTVEYRFATAQRQFQVLADFTFTGAKLGLSGKQASEIKGSLFTGSSFGKAAKVKKAGISLDGDLDGGLGGGLNDLGL